MKPSRLIPALAGAAAVAMFAAGAGAVTAKAVAELKDGDGQTVGTVELGETPSGIVLVRVSGAGLPAGELAIHVHETGSCDTASGFKSAGDHLAGDRQHGVFNEDGPHPGDLPNLFVQNDGKFAYEAFLTPRSTDRGWFDEVGLFDEDGAAVVVHAAPDDHTSQPSGSSGDRIACGVLERG